MQQSSVPRPVKMLLIEDVVASDAKERHVCTCASATAVQETLVFIEQADSLSFLWIYM